MSSGAVAAGESFDFAAQRRIMVDSQVRTFDVTDLALQAAMYEIPRERFVASESVPLAYADRTVLSAGGRRMLLAPMVIARMIQAAGLKGSDKVLDVGGGAGYGAALIARLAGAVVALEVEPGLTAAARAALAGIGETKVTCVTGALEEGHAAAKPYDAIIVEGCIEVTPSALLGQLRDGGRLIAIDGSSGAPNVVRFERIGADVSVRPLFDAGGPVLDGFRRPAAFVF
jgi:protein-L-isoaspartate(D-aspartate) O-methyltransferase